MVLQHKVKSVKLYMKVLLVTIHELVRTEKSKQYVVPVIVVRA